MTGWHCMGCGTSRPVLDFGARCECGAYAMQFLPVCPQQPGAILVPLDDVGVTERAQVLAKPKEGPVICDA